MEIQAINGSKIRLKPDSTTIFGRKNIVNTNDSTISRNHILFSPTNQTSPRVSFQVIGKNPIWVYSKNEGKKIKTLKRFEKGELGIGDYFCVFGKNPVWFMVNEVKDEIFEGDLSETLEDKFRVDSNFDFKLDSVDISSIDPVQEFGFLVIGHEFDQYPKKMIREIKNWDWFLSDPIGGSDDEDDESEETKANKGISRKRKKTGGDDDVDEEWTAESEGEELTTKVQKPKYHTRSKHPNISDNKRINRNTSPGTSSKHAEVDEDEDEEVDETLGGFIVNDENVEEDEENIINDDDEEEFVEDEDDEMEE